MRAQMHRRTPSVIFSTASAMVLHPNYPLVSSSRVPDTEVNDFTFDISNDLLLNPKDIVLGEMIGKGSDTLVYKGMFKDLFPVAVKVMQPSPHIPVNNECKENFQKEVLLLSKMKHDNIVKFVGACIEPRLMIVTELIEGGTMHELLFSSLPYRIDMRVSLSYALDIARALEYMHSKGIIHRDIKPNNILVTKDLTKAKLIDLGISIEEPEDGMMTSEPGNFRYMAPEAYNFEPVQFGEKLHYDRKIDVYSFAIVLWEMLTSQQPFREMHFVKIPCFAHLNGRPSLENVPEGAASILEACWAKDPKARPEFKEIIVLLTDLLKKFEDTNESGPGERRTPRMKPFGEVREEFKRSDEPESSVLANVHEKEDHANDVLVEEGSGHEEKPEKKSKKLVLKMILPLLGMVRGCLSKRG